MTRTVLIVLSFLSPFFFPFPATLALALAASLLVPPIGILVGILVDALYFVPEVSSIPIGILSGAALTVIGLLVRRFVKTRIIGS